MMGIGHVTHIAALVLQELQVDLTLLQLIINGAFLLLGPVVSLPEI